MNQQNLAQRVALAHLGEVQRSGQLIDRLMTSEPPGPATAEYIGLIVLASGAKSMVAGGVLRVIARLDPWVLPRGVAPSGLTTTQLADAVLGLSPQDAARISTEDHTAD